MRVLREILVQARLWGEHSESGSFEGFSSLSQDGIVQVSILDCVLQACAGRSSFTVIGYGGFRSVMVGQGQVLHTSPKLKKARRACAKFSVVPREMFEFWTDCRIYCLC
ncbi:hypothetical protein RIF29_29988 [Crotalaria pallida]|uniref:Uncharacterized protein n=1 Tax=Crotalaria pallida TaxID=3830 RepID=A0AAN9EHN0_CROPI